MRNVVCIEDETEMIDLIAIILSRHGFDFHGARGGREGLTLVDAVKPDLILLDLMMPDMDGWDVFDALKSSPDTRDIPILIVTARTQNDPRLIELRAQAGIDDLITKPFGPAQLVEKVNSILARV